MTVLFMDGFDHYTTPADKGWTGGAIGAVPGFLGSGLYWPWSDHSVYRSIDPGATRVIGFRRKGRKTEENGALCRTYETGITTEHVSARYGMNGSCWLARGGTLIGTAAPAGTITDGTHFIELMATIHDTTGYAELRVDGVTVCTFTGDTRNGGGVGQVGGYATGGGGWFGNDGNLWGIDDFYVDDADFHGDCVVETGLVSGAGNYAEFTPSAGSNWQNVDEVPPDGDTTYNASDVVGARDSFALTDLVTVSGSVKAIQQTTRWRKDDAGARECKQFLRVGGTDYDAAAAVAPSTSYSDTRRIITQNPATSSAWTIAAVNALEAGYKVES